MRLLLLLIIINFCTACGKKGGSGDAPSVIINPPVLNSITIDGPVFTDGLHGINVRPAIKLLFSEPLNKSTLAAAVQVTDVNNLPVAILASLQNGDSGILVQPNSNLNYLGKYKLTVSTVLQSNSGGALVSKIERTFYTAIDSSDKFSTLTDSQLLDKVQQQTFKYFWDFGHPVSGLARERSNGDNEVVTSGGSGFGIMAIVAASKRNFVNRSDAFNRMQTIVAFLKDKAQTFHGAYPHWLNGSSGVVVPFSTKDNGADLVETSYLMQGLLSARQYFSAPDEQALRTDIDTIFRRVEWSWFRKNNENVLYWHWSPNYGWDMNMQIKGWNECLITYVLAASSPTYPITKDVYDNGWASNGGMKNTTPAYGITIPLGAPTGGPLFFSHYSFLGINPNGLTDAYANYQTQVINHTKVNYNYCVANPQNNYGYSASCWGLTASDISNGYTASSPTNDVGVIAPTAALSSMPYTPTESMNALRFFYYKLGDKIFKDYGFVDAFSLQQPWFASSYLAIDQGPIIVNIENYRSQLLWNLFMSCPEVQTGMKGLGFNL